MGTSSLDTLLADSYAIELLMNHPELRGFSSKMWLGGPVGAQRTPEQADGLRLGLQLCSLFRQAIRDGFDR